MEKIGRGCLISALTPNVLTLFKTEGKKRFKPAVRAHAHTHPHISEPADNAPARFLHLSPAASPPTCSPAAGLEGRAPDYPALGKEILRPCPENLWVEGGRKELTSNRARAHNRRSSKASRPPSCSPSTLSVGTAQANPSGRSARPQLASRCPLKSATYLHSPPHRRQLAVRAMAAGLRPRRVANTGKCATQVQQLTQ